MTKHKHNGLRLEICTLFTNKIFDYVIFSRTLLSREIIEIVKEFNLRVELKYGLKTPECVYHQRFLLGRGQNVGQDDV